MLGQRHVEKIKKKTARIILKDPHHMLGSEPMDDELLVTKTPHLLTDDNCSCLAVVTPTIRQTLFQRLPYPTNGLQLSTRQGQTIAKYMIDQINSF
jgi:hypothetical protein